MQSDRGFDINSLRAAINNHPDITPRCKSILSTYANHLLPLINQNKLSLADFANLDLISDPTREKAFSLLLRGNDFDLPMRANGLGSLLEIGFTFKELYDCNDPDSLLSLMEEPKKCKELLESFPLAQQSLMRKRLMSMMDDYVVSTLGEKTCRFIHITQNDILNTPEFAERCLLDYAPYEFQSFIKKNEVIAKFVLDRPKLTDKLDKLPLKPTQTFANSCAAYSIMVALRDLNLISASEFSRHKELEIYMNIWQTPGGTANIQAMLNYLKNQNIAGEIIEDKSITEAIIQSRPVFMQKYEKEIKPQKITNFNIDILGDNDHFIIFVINAKMGLHALILTRRQNNFILTDPDTLKNIESNSLPDALKNIPSINAKYIYTGIGLKISPQARPEQILSTAETQTLFAADKNKQNTADETPQTDVKPGSKI